MLLSLLQYQYHFQIIFYINIIDNNYIIRIIIIIQANLMEPLHGIMQNVCHNNIGIWTFASYQLTFNPEHSDQFVTVALTQQYACKMFHERISVCWWMFSHCRTNKITWLLVHKCEFILF